MQKTINPIIIIKSFLLLIWENPFSLNDDDPHFKQIILPPKDLSDTNAEEPQLRQILFDLIK